MDNGMISVSMMCVHLGQIFDIVALKSVKIFLYLSQMDAHH